MAYGTGYALHLLGDGQRDRTGKEVLKPGDPDVEKRCEEIATKFGYYSCIAPYCQCEYVDWCEDKDCEYCHGACA